jgi:hypothetical protein
MFVHIYIYHEVREGHEVKKSIYLRASSCSSWSLEELNLDWRIIRAQN